MLPMPNDEKIKHRNENFCYLCYKFLIIHTEINSSSQSGKTNALLNLLNHQFIKLSLMNLILIKSIYMIKIIM